MRLTPLSVVVLGLLREGDMHPYEMRRLIRERRDDRLVSIANGTFYHAVGRLERDGLIVRVGVDRQGARPERTGAGRSPTRNTPWPKATSKPAGAQLDSARSRKLTSMAYSPGVDGSATGSG